MLIIPLNNEQGNLMSFFEQMKQQMQEQLNQQQQASYLLPSDLNTVVELLYNLSGGRVTQPDVSLLEGCNVKCYSQGNGMYTERDVVEVFNFIQKM